MGAIYKDIIGDRTDIKYVDNKYRLQQSFKGILAPPSPPDLFVKRGLFEYKQKPLKMDYLGDCASIKINELTEGKIKIIFQHCEQLINEQQQKELIVILDK
jgi:hypothetical protein